MISVAKITSWFGTSLKIKNWTLVIFTFPLAAALFDYIENAFHIVLLNSVSNADDLGNLSSYANAFSATLAWSKTMMLVVPKVIVFFLTLSLAWF